MKKLFLILTVPLVLAYATIVAGFYLYQQNLVFVPRPLNGITPKKYGLTQYRDVKIKTPDGFTLDAWWIKHEDKKHRPVLLYCHGNAANLSLLSEVSKIFYDYGFDALIFDYRSYGDSTGKLSDLSEKAMDTDAMTAFKWLRKKGIEESDIIIWGHSLGSSVAAELAAGTHPAGLILEGAFPSIYSVSRARFPWLLIAPFMIHDKFTTANYVADRHCPLLEIHAEKDTIIPIGLGEEVFKTAAEPKEWLLAKNIDHNDFPSVASQYQEPIMNFVTKCLLSTSKR